jgi:hypothetical protein
MENNPAPHSQSGWNEYSRLVLKELETLSTGIVNLNSEIQEIKREIALIKDREDKVEVLRVWKGKMEDIVSPTQLKEIIDEVHDLRNFKTKAVTVFIVIQFIVALLQIFKDKIFH